MLAIVCFAVALILFLLDLIPGIAPQVRPAGLAALAAGLLALSLGR